MTGLYVFGILMGILSALLLKNTLFKGKPVPFVMELPAYRLPSAKKRLSAHVGKGKRFYYESIYNHLFCDDCDLAFAKL